MDAEAVAVLQEAIGDMLKYVYLRSSLNTSSLPGRWLARDQKKYFLAPLEAYDNTALEYQRLANS